MIQSVIGFTVTDTMQLENPCGTIVL